MNNPITNIKSNFSKQNANNTSNIGLLEEIEKDSSNFQKFKIYGYLSELQKQKINPLLGLSNDLVLIGSAESPYYHQKVMIEMLK